MKQYEAVIRIMEENGGYATLGFLNQNIFKVKDCEWGTKTPFASIRRIVQDKRFFFKIRPGLWALKTYKNKIPPDVLPPKDQPISKQKEYNHAFYQGLLIEVGNYKKFGTFVSYQDKNKSYLGRKLSEITSVQKIHRFSYDNIIHITQSVDVVWFNERNMPDSFFEIEHSTDIKNSILKFVELQDFNANFCIVADEARGKEFQEKIALSAFKPINKRVRFWSYDNVAELHARTSASMNIESTLGL